MLWYHDHAFGITRLNVYAGLAGLYFIRDTTYDTGVPGTGLKLPAGPYEVPLVIQDKQFNANGSLFYPTTSGVPTPYPHPIWVPEFFGDTAVVNAVVTPFLAVEPRRYRFRIVNGAQARFFNLSLNGPIGQMPFWIIGMEQGFLAAPVMAKSILLSPGERADIIVDFAGLPKKASITMTNNAKAPYPGGKGGQVTQIMQFQVTKPLNGTDSSVLPQSLTLPPMTSLGPAVREREIVMKETFDPATGVPTDVRLNGKWFDEPVDETPGMGDIEDWLFVNLTVDAHPMHMHLVQFKVINRRPFNAAAYATAWQAWVAAGRPIATKPNLNNYWTGPAVGAAPEESGWKDTAKAYPGQVLRVRAKFDLPPVPNTYPSGLPTTEYVYHCHILEHEENEMMRPFTVG